MDQGIRKAGKHSLRWDQRKRRLGTGASTFFESLVSLLYHHGGELTSILFIRTGLISTGSLIKEFGVQISIALLGSCSL